MNRHIVGDRELGEAIDALPRSIAPRRDLWPDIEQQLEDRQLVAGRQEQKTGWRVPAVAAALVVAFATGILMGRQLQQPLAPQDPILANRALLAATQASEREYQAAFRQFTPIDSVDAALGQQAVQSIEGSWQELLQTEAALLAALEEYPENAYLNQRLLDLRARQLQFMKQMVALDSSSWRRT
jgi:hypothetical protein